MFDIIIMIMIICRTRQAHSQERWEACSGLHCVKLPKIPWYFCQDILGFRLVSCKIRKPIFPHSTEKSGEILSRFGLLISWNIQGIYILGFSHGIFQYSLDITMDIQSKYRKYHWYTSVYPPDLLSNSSWIFVYIYYSRNGEKRYFFKDMFINIYQSEMKPLHL